MRTKRKVEPIRVVLLAEIKDIIKRWGNEKIIDKTFILLVLTKNVTAERERQLIQQRTRLINDHIKEIGKIAGIKKMM